MDWEPTAIDDERSQLQEEFHEKVKKFAKEKHLSYSAALREFVRQNPRFRNVAM